MSPRAAALGVLVAVAVASVYGLAAEAVELTFGLIAVALVGGYVIGASVKPSRRAAVGLSVGAWALGLFVAYVVSEALLPQPSTPLAARLNAGGFAEFLSGLELMTIVHGISLAGMAFAAWRGAR